MIYLVYGHKSLIMKRLSLLLILLSSVASSASAQAWYQGGKPAAGWVTVKGAAGPVHIKPVFKVARSVVIDVAHTMVASESRGFIINRQLVGCGNDFFATIAALPLGASPEERNRLYVAMNTDILDSPEAALLPIDLFPVEPYFGKTKQFVEALARICATTKPSLIDIDIPVAVSEVEATVLRVSDMRVLSNGQREVWSLYRPIRRVPVEVEDAEGTRMPWTVQGEVLKRHVYSGKVTHKALYRIDCKAKRIAITYVVRSDGSSSVRLSEAQIDNDFSPVVPDSVGEGIFQLVCLL